MTTTHTNNTTAKSGYLFGKDNHYKHNQLRKYTAVFGSLFSDLYVSRENNGKTEYILVPLRYGGGYMYEKTEQGDGMDNKRTSTALPAMSFYITGIQPDETRAVQRYNPMQSSTLGIDDNAYFTVGRKAYDVAVTLDIRTKTMDDMLNIVEQIVGNCYPDITVRVEDELNLNAEQDITIVMGDVSLDDNYQDYTQARIIQSSITFTIKGYLYSKMYKAPIIKDFALYASLSTPTYETTNITDTEISTEVYAERITIAKGLLYDNANQATKEAFNDVVDGLSDFAGSKKIDTKTKPKRPRGKL